MKKNYDVIIVGGGFGGLHCAMELANSDKEILLIDKNNYHLFKPLLYQVATGALESSKISSTFREVLREHDNITVMMAEVKSVDPNDRFVIADAQKISFDKLILAVGDQQSYFGNEEWKDHTIGLKSLNDAFNLRNKIFQSYELAEKSDDEDKIKKNLTFVIVGGGPTGVELAGAISEIAYKTMIKDFKRINPAHTKVYLLEAGKDVLAQYSSELSKKAIEHLEDLGVIVMTNTPVNEIESNYIVHDDGKIETSNIFWAAGNEGGALASKLEVEKTKNKKIHVNPDLSMKNYKDIYVIGDAAYLEQDGKPLPGLAPVAIQQGRYLARKIKGKTQKKFRYNDKGSLATIGKSKAVGTVGRFELSGTIAWLTWSIVHLYYLILKRNRFFLFISWVREYFSSERAARIIVQEEDN